jgi:hypothetical protein
LRSESGRQDIVELFWSPFGLRRTLCGRISTVERRAIPYHANRFAILLRVPTSARKGGTGKPALSLPSYDSTESTRPKSRPNRLPDTGTHTV